MHVSGFMVPYDKVHKCHPSNTVGEVLEILMDNRVSCLVIVIDDKPAGIITTTDLCWCYRNNMPHSAHVGDIMPWTAGVKKIKSNIDRDSAAKFFEKNKVHHALVEDENGEAVGIISALDIAYEVAKDARAWPYHRSVTGRIEAPKNI